MLCPRRAFACLVVALCVAGPLTQGRAASGEFPFGAELMLDVTPLPGSKRVPLLEIEDNGAASIDLWCASLHATATVGDDSISIVPGPADAVQPVQPAQCAPDRQSGDANLLAALAQVTSWHRSGEFIELRGPTTLRFHLMTN